MNRGFYIILVAQFLSALADNALLFAAIALLTEMNAPVWHTPLLLQFFVFSYIILAPYVGSIADAFPKGRVMFASNGIKILGSVCMLFGMQPLFAYGIVGIGAAAYSPAKYGILTEYLPARDLVVANGWMEGTTVAAIILGAIIGGKLANDNPHTAMIIITLVYVAAAFFNYYIPKLDIKRTFLQKNPWLILKDFWHSFIVLWCDKLGQVSLSVTTLFWGAGATLRLLVIVWAASALNYDLEQSTQLTAIVAVGIAIGSVIAARYVKIEQSIKVLPAGIVMGILMLMMIFIHNVFFASILMLAIGILSGYFVVPLNALLQHRGHELIGAGHSIAVQNFNENLGILIMTGVYGYMLSANFSFNINLPVVGHLYSLTGINTIILVFGLFISISMYLITRFYKDTEYH